MSRRQSRSPQTRLAHFPGGGPADRVCGECRHWEVDRRLRRICRRAADMAGLPPEDCQPVSHYTAACKYFTPTETTR